MKLVTVPVPLVGRVVAAPSPIFETLLTIICDTFIKVAAGTTIDWFVTVLGRTVARLPAPLRMRTSEVVLLLDAAEVVERLVARDVVDKDCARASTARRLPNSSDLETMAVVKTRMQ